MMTSISEFYDMIRPNEEEKQIKDHLLGMIYTSYSGMINIDISRKKDERSFAFHT